MALMHNFYCKKGVLIFLLCVLVQLYYHDLYFEQQDHLLQLCPFLCWVWSYIFRKSRSLLQHPLPHWSSNSSCAIHKYFQSVFDVLCKFDTFFLVLNPHRIHLSAMLHLALFKEPALYCSLANKTFHVPNLLAQNPIVKMWRTLADHVSGWSY